MTEKRDEKQPGFRDHAKLATSLSLVNRTIGTLISTLQDLDKMQQQALSIGIKSSTAMHAMGDTIKGHPGGIKSSFESAMSLMQVGLFKHSKGMIRLMQVTKATGQNQEAIAAGFGVLAGAMPLSRKAMGKLSFDMIDLTHKWGIQTTALMKVIQQNSKTLGRLSALGGNTEANATAIGKVVSRAGLPHAKAVSMLAEKFTFKGGGDDLMKMVVQLGNRQDLAQRIRTDDMSEGLLMDINKAVLATYDQQVMRGTEDKFIRSLTAQGLTFDLEQIAQQRALQTSYDNASNLQQMGLKEQNVKFNNSLSIIFSELIAPFQALLIPWLEYVGGILVALREKLGNSLHHIAGGINILIKLFLIIKTFTILNYVWTKISAIAGAGWQGLIVLGLAGVGSAIYDSMATNKAIANTQKRDEDARQEIMLQNRKAHERFVHKAMMAASLINQNLARPIGDKTLDMLESVRNEISKVNISVKDTTGVTSRSNPL